MGDKNPKKALKKKKTVAKVVSEPMIMPEPELIRKIKKQK